MRMRIKIRKIDDNWIGQYILPTGVGVTVTGGQGFTLFCLYLTYQWKQDAALIRLQGWRVRY